MPYKIKFRTALLTLALVAVVGIPVTARALGLGELQSNTRIGQPFSARIPITGVSSSELQGLHVALASPDAYKAANLNVPDYLYSLKFSVEQGSKGPYIKVSSEEPVKLPFLNILINARWNSGQVTRQYTVLLNPPVFVSGTQSQQPVTAPSSPAQAQQPAAPPKPTAQQSAPEQQQPAENQQTMPAQQQPVQPTQTQQQQQPVQTQPATAPAKTAYSQQQETSSQPTPSTYTVQHGDTLWGLSRRMRPSNSVSVNQMMIALYRANPHAFRGNINRMKSGVVLQVPSQSQIAQITAEEATRIVARQNNEWQGGQPATQVASNSNAAANTSGVASASQPTETQSPSKETAGESQAAESEQAAPAGTAGRVVLTTPEVTASTSVAAAPGSAAAGTSSSAAVSGAAVASAAASNQTAANSAEPGATGASVGGPVKIQSNSMAGLASAGTSSAATAATGSAANAKTAATTTSAQSSAQAKQSTSAANSVNTVNSVNTASTEESEGGSSSGLMYWITQPSGWIVIAAIVLLLGALLLFLMHRKKANANVGGQAIVDESPSASDGHDAGPEASGHIEDGIPHETESSIANVAAEADSAGKEDVDDLGIATYIGGPSLDVNKVDAIDEADLHVGFGDYNKAVEVLRTAIEHDPSRPQLHKKLLDVLFAAGDAAGFVSEAAVYRDQVDASAWEEVAVMGRQLLPQEPLFAANGVAAGEEAQGNAEADDFLNIDLDRLSSDTEGNSDQNEFERTMDELSTFIETYVPASADTPVSLQLPPEEEQASAHSKTDVAASISEDEPLEFTLDDDDLPSPNAGMGLSSEEDEESGEENLVDTKLDLARAYIDMGDGDSARSVLEEVIDEGDETQSGEARRLLETLA